MKKQLVSMLLVLCMVITVLPYKVQAAASGNCGANVIWTLDDDGTMVISGTGTMKDRFHEPQSAHVDLGNGWIGTPLGQMDRAFWVDSRIKLTRVIIESGVTNIGAGVFSGSEMTSVSIPSTVVEIGAKAFESCYSLPSITIPDSVTTLGHDAFAFSAIESISIPSSIAHIAESAFKGCAELTRVEIQDGVASIGDDAFQSCTNLSYIKIPDSVTEIGWSAFLQCYNLTQIELPSSLKTIKGYAFQQCRSLTSITIPEGITEIEMGTFNASKSLATVTIPNTVTSIGNHAFRDCDALSDVYYNGSKEQWDAIEIGNENNPLKNATIHFSIQSPEPAPTQTPTEPQDTQSTVPAYNEEPHGLSFNDVSSSSPFAEAIDWAVNHGITTGKTATTFAPNESCTNAQILTFLWRGYGEPEPSIQNPYKNVNANQYYYKAALWAYENGMVSGETFEGDQPCTRASAVTYMWKAAMSPQPDSIFIDFSDVLRTLPYAEAISWAVERGITSGTTPTTFSPDRTCTRGQIVTFIYRGL